uniref:Uncharacterized protein n=1 Tax=Oryza punctata TaxID=4537 RepID=A0A0E0MLQ1_ORYPU
MKEAVLASYMKTHQGISRKTGSLTRIVSEMGRVVTRRNMPGARQTLASRLV